MSRVCKNFSTSSLIQCFPADLLVVCHREGYSVRGRRGQNQMKGNNKVVLYAIEYKMVPKPEIEPRASQAQCANHQVDSSVV